ncbi:hypothetical protein [Kineosporia succinea]|uniref:Uncharacterized protein n=1 Tax=Kineosporia succinea TaxID=84632 RepID=A0ABT9PBM2_9ACTN|nr:hypothetical protein [Kineosporia succinea]MDP9829415.1 hypothetical protein [Kineosporia succinea]
MDQIQTWQQTGRFLTPAQLDQLTADERAAYFADSAVRSVEEIDRMPEPHRSIFQHQAQALRNRRQDRAAS